MTDMNNMKKYYFTFMGDDLLYHNKVQPILAEDYGAARSLMFGRYGDKWAFQYTQEQWEEWENKRPWYYPKEIELPPIVQGSLNEAYNITKGI